MKEIKQFTVNCAINSFFNISSADRSCLNTLFPIVGGMDTVKGGSRKIQNLLLTNQANFSTFVSPSIFAPAIPDILGTGSLFGSGDLVQQSNFFNGYDPATTYGQGVVFQLRGNECALQQFFENVKQNPIIVEKIKVNQVYPLRILGLDFPFEYRKNLGFLRYVSQDKYGNDTKFVDEDFTTYINDESYEYNISNQFSLSAGFNSKVRGVRIEFDTNYYCDGNNGIYIALPYEDGNRCITNYTFLYREA